MTLAAAKEKFSRISAACIVAFGMIPIYQVPWRDWVLAM